MREAKALEKLDGLLLALEHESGDRIELLREHLQGARSYLVGAMPAEYQLNLRLAEKMTDCVNKELSEALAGFIRAELSAPNGAVKMQGGAHDAL